jgi:hypothetical protein
VAEVIFAQPMSAVCFLFPLNYHTMYDEHRDKYVFAVAISWEYDQLHKANSEFFAKFQ